MTSRFNIKTISRLAAVQTLYQYSNVQKEINYAILAEQMLKLYDDNTFNYILSSNNKIKLNKTYYKDLVKYSVDNIEYVNDIIIKNLDSENKELTNLSNAILLVAICELLYFLSVPQKVVINEYTNIASTMLNHKEVNFINSILDTIAQNARTESSK
ncbi:MAG: transcription antitermination factor NusB [Rickettsiaceae bacterium]